MATGLLKTEPSEYSFADQGDGEKKAWLVDLMPVRELSEPVPLTVIKADGSCADFPLVRMGRLSVMPVLSEHWPRILRMEREDAD
jgi:predicted RNA-binding protein with PUA-like domain